MEILSCEVGQHTFFSQVCVHSDMVTETLE